MNDTPETAGAPQTMKVPATAERLAEIFEPHFKAHAFGLLTCYATLPPQMVWEAMAAAMGGVLSGATASDDIALSLAARGRLGDIVNTAIRKRYPLKAAKMPTPANGNGPILPH